MLQLTLSLLKSCKTQIHLKQIQASTTKTGLDNDPIVAGNLLLSTFSISGLLDDACRMFSFIRFPDAFMFNTVIRGLSDSSKPDQAVAVYAQMRRRSVPQDSFTFAFALKAAANYRSLRAGCQIHSDVVCHGLDGHLFVDTTLVSMYAECGRLLDAQKVFGNMLQPNVVAWNALLTAFLRAEDLNGAEKTFAQMPWRNQTSWNIMLAGYAKAGNMGMAKRVFLDMQHKDPVSWSTMITGFSSSGCFNDAFTFFRELLRSKFSPNEVSLTGVLSACAQAGAFELGKILHGYMEKTGSIRIVSVSNALLDTYAKCGNIELSSQVFNSTMETKCIVSWTSMITALAMHGLGQEAIELFHRMQEHGIKPDGITFISLLYACSHSGLVDEGYDYFCKMEKEYGINRSAEHYGCMVDLYGRSGQLDKAYNFIKQMTIKPNAIIWRTLLGACSIHGQVELAELVKKQLSELDPNDSSDYILLSNIYSITRKWNDAENVRISMSKKKMQKTPGWSTIEIDKEIYLFIANEEPKGSKVEAHRKLKEIIWRLREEGYSPETLSVLHDIEDEEKQDAISRHSEKLAVAFGIARTSRSSVIRIVKNLRVCRDCHVVMKLISKVYHREIIVRDRSRFHSFREGLCSCNDYW